MGFVARLQALTDRTRGIFEAGSPMVEPHVAEDLSGLYHTFGPMLSALPRNQSRAIREGFVKDVVQLDRLQKAIATTIAGGDEAALDAMMTSGAHFMEKAEEAGLVARTAKDKNALYRFNVDSSSQLRGILEANKDRLHLGDDLDEYFRYIMDLNMNVNDYGRLTVSPNRSWTGDAVKNVAPAYSRANWQDPHNVWNPTKPRNFITFDLETAGGPANAANVNEVYAQSTRIGAGGVSMGPDVWHSRFSVNSMTMGVIGNKGVAETLNMKFAPPAGSPEALLFGKVSGDGSEFVKGVRPLLEAMASDDVNGILGQNIMGFDIDRLIGNVVRTSEYQSGGAIKAVVDKLQGKMSGGGFVVDTIQMLSEYEQFKGKGITKSALLPEGAPTRSIENILLNSNLVDLMKSKADGSGGKSLWELATEVDSAGMGGHHTGRYDSIVTSALYQSMLDDTLEFGTPSALSTREIKDILTAKAYTPMSTMTRPEDILDPVWRQMHEIAQDDPSVMRLRSTLNPNITRSAADESASEMRRLAGLDNWYLDTNVSFLEQASMHTRNLARYSTTATSDDVMDLVSSQGDRWRDMTGMNTPFAGTLNKGSSMFKHGVGFNLDDFAKYQDSIADLPFSHIGMPERMVTMAATMGSQLLPNAHLVEEVLPGAMKAASFAEDMGVSFFPMDNTLLKGSPVSIAGRSTGSTLAMTMPEAQRINELVGGGLFGSDFEEGGLQRLLVNADRGTSEPFVNLQLEVDRSTLNAEALTKIEGRLKDAGMEGEDLNRALGFFDPTNETPGRITVGSMRGAAAETMIDAMELTTYDLHQGKRMYMPLLSAHEADVAGETVGVLKVGPVMIGEAYTGAEREGMVAQVGRTNEIFEDLRGRVHTGKFAGARAKKGVRNKLNAARQLSLGDIIPEDHGARQYREAKAGAARKAKQAYEAGGDFLSSSGVVKDADAGAKILRRATMPALVGGAIAMFVAKKSRETNAYDETFEMGDRSPNGYYSGGGFSAADPIHKRVSPRLNALATANLVFDNYDNRIGHTRPPGRV